MYEPDDAGAFPPSSRARRRLSCGAGLDRRPGEVGHLRPATSHSGTAGVYYGSLPGVERYWIEGPRVVSQAMDSDAGWNRSSAECMSFDTRIGAVGAASALVDQTTKA